MVKKSKSNRPLDNPFTQQKLPAWQPILSVHWVVLSFLVLFAVFTPIGIGLIFASKSVQEIVIDYTDKCTQVAQPVTYQPYCEIDVLEFEVKNKMEQPIYMYYKLDNFYQNHRRYASSRSDRQLGGQKVSISDAQSSCSPIWSYSTSKNESDVTDADVYNPCGLIAWSMFNDTISLYKYTSALKDTSELVCSGARPIGSENPEPDVKCTKVGIAWASDRDVKFKKPTGNNLGNRMYPDTYFNEDGHVIPSHDDEDFMVWMRTSALPNFRKLYRIITTDLTPGYYYFKIDYNYPVKGFGGSKSVVLSNVSFLGGENLFLAISYVSVGGICLILAVLFLLAWISQFIFRKVRAKAANA